MTAPTENSNTPYIFWLFDWGVNDVYTVIRWTPLHIRCAIDQNGIRIDFPGQPPLLTYDQIVDCKKYVFSQGRNSGSTVNVELILKPEVVIQKGRLSNHILYLVTVHPFKNYPSFDESDAMILVINEYRAGNVPTLSRNPYEREFIRKGKPAQFDPTAWDANIRPDVYTPTPKLWRLIVFIIFLGIIVVPCVMVFLWLVTYWLGLHPGLQAH